MQQGQRAHFWLVFQAAVLSALFAFFWLPQTASAHLDIGADTYSTVNIQHKDNPASDGPFGMFGHYHSGLDCSVQAAFASGCDARFIDADLRPNFRSVDNTMVSWPVSFDPPLPRVLS